MSAHSPSSRQTRDDPYGVLFDPVRIGPVTAPNRFYQVPHCTGMGHRYPRSEARLRGIKAEGGWGVVSTQETEIHRSSDLSPANEARLWDDQDMPALQLMADAVHARGALAAIQLAHNGIHAGNSYSREPLLGPSLSASHNDAPIQARAMDLSDIKAFRKWHVDAALRAKCMGFDIVYVYAGHDMTLLQHFLLNRYNHRSDAYGGSFENRLRLFREVLADTRDAVGDRCAVAVRLPVDELLGSEGLQHDGEARDVITALAEEPDLWDVNLSGWENDSQTSRFSEEGFQDHYTRFVKSVTSKPVVGVGRYTSPDTMVRLIRSGHLDLIGAARPSIADPFLPSKIRDGRIDEIRECIGCNICTAGDNTDVPMRCTQNPTIGEEWRRGWHPEIIPQLRTPEPVLIIGGGPAGLEAARALVQRGADVTLAEQGDRWGGRVTRESALPGLSAWNRVRDWRLGPLQQSAQAELYLNSSLTADDVLSYGIPQVAIATGSTWRADGMGRHHRHPVEGLAGQSVLTPDDMMTRGTACLPTTGPVVIFDDDHYYMGSVLAEMAVAAGHDVVFVTPSSIVASWSENTLEQDRIQLSLINAGVRIVPLHGLVGWDGSTLTLACVYSERETRLDCAALVTVTSRTPRDTLWRALDARRSEWGDAGIQNIKCIGDAFSPGLIAAAVHDGHAYARSIAADDDTTIRREDFDMAL